MKKHTQKRVRVHPLLLSFQFVLLEIAVVVALFTIVVQFDLSRVIHAGIDDYDLTSTVSGQNVRINISPSTGADGIVLFIYNRDNGSQVTSFNLNRGSSGINWTGSPGNYEARLVWIFSEIARRENFSIAAQPGWNLSAPSKNIGDVVFSFSPAIGTEASLIIRNATTNALVKDSGALVSGSSTYIWADAPAGNYKAVLFYYPNAISNEITVRVDRKAVMEKSEPRCGTTGWPNNIIVRHQWKAARGTFSSQAIQISTNSNFSSNLQERSVSSSTTSYELSGYGPNREYFARIKSVTNDGRTIYSRVQGYHTMDCPNTGLEVPLPTSVSGLPACVNTGSTYGSGITLNWNTVTGATSYTARFTKGNVTNGDYAIKSVNGNSAGGSGSWNPGGNPLVTWVSGGNLNLQPGETYYFAVSAQNGTVNSGYNLTGRSLQVGPVPICNTAVQPPIPTGVDGLPICVQKDATYGGNLNFKWNTIAGASSYTVRLAHNVNTSGDYAIKTVTTNSAGGSGNWNPGGNPLVTWVSGGNLAMKPGVKYFYTVKATVNGLDTGYDLLGKSMQVGPVYLCIGEGADTDGDGFSDSAESYIGTSINEKCGPGAFPPDINNDGNVNSADQGLMASSVVSREGDEKYNKRADLNADKAVNSADQGILARYVGKNCQTLGVNTGEVKAVTTPTNLQIGKTSCSDAPYGVVASWDGQGDYWVDFTWDNWATFNKKHVTPTQKSVVLGSKQITPIPYEFENPYYVTFPGRDYQWRIWNGSQHFSGPSFKVTTCSSGVGAEYSELRDFMYMIGVNKYVLGGHELKKVLYGLSGCETGRTWNPSIVNPTGTYIGLFQYDKATWSARLRENGYSVVSVEDVDSVLPRADGFKQIEFTGKYIVENQWLGPWGDYCASHWSDTNNLDGAP